MASSTMRARGVRSSVWAKRSPLPHQRVWMLGLDGLRFMSSTRRADAMFGSRRRRVGMPMFLVGLSLMGTGIGWEVPALAIGGLVLFVVGIVLLWRRRKEFSVY